MRTVRCTICRQQFKTIKMLKYHYNNRHSKLQMIKQLIKSSIMQSTPNLFRARMMERRRNGKNNDNKIEFVNITKNKQEKTLYRDDKIHISYGNNEIIIENEMSNNSIVQLTLKESLSPELSLFIDNDQNNNIKSSASMIAARKIIVDSDSDSSATVKRRPRRNRSHFHIDIKKFNEPTKSLDTSTGLFYTCHCMDNNNNNNDDCSTKNLSDTESCSETGRFGAGGDANTTTTKLDNHTYAYCLVCGNRYGTQTELIRHVEFQHQLVCKICNETFAGQNELKIHIQQHLLKVYSCHLCNNEFVYKEMLRDHINYHFEQETLEGVLDMEEEYNNRSGRLTSNNAGAASSSNNNNTNDYTTSINNILFYLTYPYDHHYCRNMLIKVVCDICLQEFYVYDYERHIKVAHNNP